MGAATEASGRLTAIHVHPLKSGAIRPLDAAAVSARGLADDRSWVVVDGSGVMVSARTDRRLFHVLADTPTTRPGQASALRLASHRDAEAPQQPLEVAEPTGEPVGVRLHSQHLLGVDAGDAAAAWLRRALGRDDVRLLWCDDPTRRTLEPAYAQPGDHTAYADSFPVTIASTASLARLNELIAQDALERGEEPPAPLPMERFRPNLVVDGFEPFAEDGWQRVRVGELWLRRAKPAGRCVMTTIDPDSLAGGKEPVRTLARHRLVDGKTLFALHLVPESPGTVRVGDPVEAR